MSGAECNRPTGLRGGATGLLRRYRETRDPAARERLIELHLPLVRALARRYANRGELLEDLVQVGAIGLIEAIDRFDPEKGSDFASFAVPTITGEIRNHLRDRTTVVRIPRRAGELNVRLRAESNVLAARLCRPPTLNELAREAGIEENDVLEAMRTDRVRTPVPLPTGNGNAPAGRGHPRRRRLRLERRPAPSRRGLPRARRSTAADRAPSLLRGPEPGRDRPRGRPLPDPGLASHQGLAGPNALRAGPRPRAGTRRQPLGRALVQSQIGLYTGNVVGVPSLAEDMAPSYRISLIRSGEGPDASWLAEVEGLPNCSRRGATPDEAVQQAWAAVEELTPPAREAGGQSAPEPKAAARHSGKLLVRMPATLHDELARAAEAEGVSLNQLITGRPRERGGVAIRGRAAAWRNAAAGADALRTAHARRSRGEPRSRPRRGGRCDRAADRRVALSLALRLPIDGGGDGDDHRPCLGAGGDVSPRERVGRGVASRVRGLPRPRRAHRRGGRAIAGRHVLGDAGSRGEGARGEGRDARPDRRRRSEWPSPTSRCTRSRSSRSRTSTPSRSREVA